jgi:class 3 adenylate cyclase/tetratricopeptide (TPR) repeat protein
MADPTSPRARRSLPDLSKLYGSLEETPVSAPPDLAQPESPLPSAPAKPVEAAVAPAEGAALQLSPELQTYLPPDLWRKLSSDTLRRGILINVLERMNSLLYTISTYIPGDLVQEKMSRPIPGLVNGKMLNGCLLFSDVSGFTALSERLAVLGPQGAEHLTRFINQYFTSMIDILSRSNGTLLKFAGDATLVYFPEQENGAHVQWAARAGLRMLRAMQDFANIPTPLGPVTLSMKLGVSAGTFLAASIGSPKRMEYALISDTVSQTLQAEGCASPGQMVTNQAAADVLRAEYAMSEVKPGFFLLQPGEDQDGALGEFEIRAEKRRARSAVQWDTSLEEIAAQIEMVLRQIQALTPYLASELVDRIIAHAYQRQVQSEYRSTAVMFCNFTGPEALLAAWGEAGTQRVTGLLSAYFSDINEVISRFGGIVSRIDPYSQGTKLLALFGAPVAHEDDPQRAVNAALAMNSALQALNRRWQVKLARHLPPGSPAALIEHRIGITLGETYAGQAGSSTRREYTVMGDEVNLAARLMSASRPGQILISERIYERTNPYYVHSKLAPVRVKGKKKPIPIWQVDGPREDTLLNRIGSRAPLIGRVPELARGWEVFERVRAGTGGLLTLTGPAGIGKSHLADALLTRALEAGWQVQAFQCRSYLTEEAFVCWSGLLRALAGLTSLDHPLIQKEKLERLTAQLQLSSTQAAALTDLLGLRQVQVDSDGEAESGDAPEEDLSRLLKQKKPGRRASSLEVFNQLDGMAAVATNEIAPTSDRETTRRWQALAAVCSALAEQKPLVIFFEDAQWMDSASRDCLERLTQELAARPVLFLLARRPQGVELQMGETIPLKPFTAPETSAMVAAILTAGLADIIHEQSNGSPLFVEEISRWMKRTYSIDEAGLKNVLQSSDILQKLVLSSLESLPESQREVARMASVSGVEFRRSEVEVLLEGELDPVTFNAYLHGLTQANLITLSEASVDARYSFVQSIFRDILYASLPFERRRELHARLAEHLKTLPSRRRQLRDKIAAFLETGSEVQPIHTVERLAYHYEMSEQWLAAAQQLIEAAEQLSPAEQAGMEKLYGRALTLLEHYPPEATDPEIGLQKARAHLGLGDAAVRGGDLVSAAVEYEAAVAAAPKENVPLDLVLGLTARQVLVSPSQGKIGPAEKQLDGLPEGNWKTHAMRGWLLWRAGRETAPVVAACRAALPEAASPERARVEALLTDLSGDWAQASTAYRQLGEVHGAALAEVRLGDQSLRQEDPATAGEHYEAAAALWQTAKSDCGLALVQYRQAELAWRARQNSQVLTLLEKALLSLDKSSLALQTGPRAAIQNALARVKKNQAGAWDAWQWQPFEDLFWIQFFFPLFRETLRNNS